MRKLHEHDPRVLTKMKKSALVSIGLKLVIRSNCFFQLKDRQCAGPATDETQQEQSFSHWKKKAWWFDQILGVINRVARLITDNILKDQMKGCSASAGTDSIVDGIKEKKWRSSRWFCIQEQPHMLFFRNKRATLSNWLIDRLWRLLALFFRLF